MNHMTTQPEEACQSGAKGSGHAALNVLVVGPPLAQPLPETVGRVTVTAFASVTDEYLRRCRPDYVISPLVTRDFDAIELACALDLAGFSGRYRATTGALPDRALIRQEISACCPGLDFDFWTPGTDL